MLTIDALSFGFRRNRPLFTDFTAEFRRGKTLLLGPNGAGKSTLLGLAAGIIKATSGNISPDRHAIALMPQVVPAIRGLTVREQVAYSGWLAGKASEVAWNDSEHLLALVGLTEKSEVKVRAISGGQLRRVGIACNLATDAEVLLFDEPTAGLDLQQAANFYQSLEVAAAGKCVVVSSHQVEGVSDFFDRVLLLNRGEIRFDGTFAEFVSLGVSLGATGQTHALITAFTQLVGVEE